MKKNTKAFINLIFEKEEKGDSGKEEKSNVGKEYRSQKAPQVYAVTTSNSIAKGRPISDPGLANIKSRAEQGAGEAVELLKDLKISKPSGKDWQDQITDLFKAAVNTEMSVFIKGAAAVESSDGKPGVVISLKPIWNQDDKGGKRSYGFLRSLLVAAGKAGWIDMGTTTSKKMRLEIVDGKNEALLYVAGKAQSWS